MRLVLLPGMDGTGRLFGPLLAALPPGIDGEPVAYPRDEPLGAARDGGGRPARAASGAAGLAP